MKRLICLLFLIAPATLAQSTGMYIVPPLQSIGGANATALQGVPLNTNLPGVGQCLAYDGTQWSPSSNCGGGGGSSVTFKVNGTNTLNQTTINFLNSSPFNGLTYSFQNSSLGNIQIVPSGTLTDSGLASAYSGIGTCGTNLWVSSLGRNAVPGCSQIGFSNLLGSIVLAQFPPIGAFTVVGNGTSGTAVPTALASIGGGTFPLFATFNGSFLQGQIICGSSVPVATNCTPGIPVVNISTTGPNNVLNSNRGTMGTLNNASSIAMTLPAPSTLPNSYFADYYAVNSGTTTFSTSGGVFIEPGNATSAIVPPNYFSILFNDGTNYWLPTMPTLAAFADCAGSMSCALALNKATGQWYTVVAGASTPAFPETVSGGVSGAITCFTNTTTLAASTLLAANGIVVGGGAGVCPSTLTGVVATVGGSLAAISLGDAVATIGQLVLNGKSGTSSKLTMGSGGGGSWNFFVPTGLGSAINLLYPPTQGVAGNALELTDSAGTTAFVTPVNSLTCDNVLFSLTGCNASTGAITLTPKNAPAHSVFANITSSPANAGFTSAPAVSSLTWFGSTSGSCAANISATGGILSFCGSNNVSVDGNGNLTADTWNTNTSCASSASPAVCGANSVGNVVIAASATTVTVNTSAVHSGSQIFVFPTASTQVGTTLGVTCNTSSAAVGANLWESSRVNNTSFTITTAGTVTTNPLCLSYHIYN